MTTSLRKGCPCPQNPVRAQNPYVKVGSHKPLFQAWCNDVVPNLMQIITAAVSSYALAMSCAEDTISQLSSPALGSYIFFYYVPWALARGLWTSHLGLSIAHHCQPFDHWCISQFAIATPCQRSFFNKGWKQCLFIGINVGILQEVWHHVSIKTVTELPY